MRRLQNITHNSLIELQISLTKRWALATLLACTSTALRAESPPHCVVIPQRALPENLPSETIPDDDKIRLESGAGAVTLGGGASLSSGVRVRRNDLALQAEEAEYDPLAGTLSLRGDVRYLGLGTQVNGSSAEFDYLNGSLSFGGSQFALEDGSARGTAGLLRLDKRGKLRLEDVTYTTCPAGKDDWEIIAGKIRLDSAQGIGEARSMRLEFKGVPILYAPYLSFPVSDARKSGLLAPQFGQTGRSGSEISIPYYWNLAPNYDLLTTARILTQRGTQLKSEFRYLTRSSQGALRIEYLPSDSLADRDRVYAGLQNRSNLSAGWSSLIDINDVSDSRYFEDLGNSLSAASVTHLNRSVGINYLNDIWRIEARLQSYQTIDDTIVASDEPYRRLPFVSAAGRWDELPGPWAATLDSEIAYFERDTGVEGVRLDVRPALRMPLTRQGLFAIPEIAYQYTHYELEDDMPEKSLSRSLPSVSLDVGAVFERDLRLGNNWVQTLQPRLLYVHTPFREQDNLPVFDTIEPDLNLVQTFRKRRYLGPDRIADGDRLSMGITSRILDDNSGRERLSATIGQTRYLSTQGVSLPGEQALADSSSDYIVELGVGLYEHWNLDLGQQWSSSANRTVKSEVRLQYRPDPKRVLNFAYRYRRGSLEQGDVSWSWPLKSRWNVVGRYNYSFRDQTSLERFIGFEYESCCWALRLISRRYISGRDGTADSSVGFQLELKGLGSVGDSADRRLERGILGYTRSNE